MTYWIKTPEERDAEREALKNRQAILKEFDTNEQVRERFRSFLERSQHTYLRFDGYDPLTDSFQCFYKPLMHRWKEEYKRALLAKCYQLNEWYKQNRQPVTLITLTTRQRGLTIPDQLGLLGDSFNKLVKAMKKALGHFEYLRVNEPHKSGYGHIHMLYFGPMLNKKKKAWIRQLWDEKYNAGTQVDFSFKRPQRDLKNAGAYVFKYLAKSFTDNIDEKFDTGEFLFNAWVREMSKRDTPYKGVRLWSCSKGISQAMKKPVPSEPSMTTWFRTCIRVVDRVTQKVRWSPLWVSDDLSEDFVYNGSHTNPILDEFDSWLQEWAIKLDTFDFRTVEL